MSSVRVSTLLLVLLIVCIAVIVVCFPASCPLLHIWIAPLILLSRYTRFSLNPSKRWFLFDICYWVHLLLWLMLATHLGIEAKLPGFIVSTSSRILDACSYFNGSTAASTVFAMSNGFLIVGVWLWRNALAPWDVDAVTSAWLHLSPAIVTLCLRRQRLDVVKYTLPTGDANEWNTALWIERFLLVVVLVVQGMLMLVKHCWLEAHLPREHRSPDAYSYFTRSRLQALVKRSSLPSPVLWIIYVLAHFVHLEITSRLGIYIWNSSMVIHGCYIVFFFLLAVYNAWTLHVKLRAIDKKTV